MKLVGRNPFSSGGPVEGDHFGDRLRETRDLVRYLLDGQNIFLISPRRYGKTSLLLKAKKTAIAQGGKVAYANLQWTSTRQEVAEEITRAVLDGIAGKGKQRVANITEFLSHIPGARVSFAGTGANAEVSVSLAPPLGSERTFLQEIKYPIMEMSKHAKGASVALIIDEFQRVAEIDKSLPGIFKAISDELAGVSLVFAGSRRHMMDEIFRGTGAALKGVAQEMALDVIPEKEMTEFLLDRTHSSGKTMTPAAAREIYTLVRGVPNAVQLLAKYTWWAAEAIIDEETVKIGLHEMLRDQSGGFSTTMSQFSSNERRCFRSLAGRTWTRVFAQDFVGVTGLSTPSVQYAIDTLCKREHILRNSEGEYRIEDPVFELWLQYGPTLDRTGN